MPSLTDTILDLIETSGLSIKEIAEKAEVPYQQLRRWVKGERGKPGGRSNRSYDVKSADRVHTFLTGRNFVEKGNL